MLTLPTRTEWTEYHKGKAQRTVREIEYVRGESVGRHRRRILAERGRGVRQVGRLDEFTRSRLRAPRRVLAIDALTRQEKINIETRRSTTPGKRVILVQGPC